MTRYRIVTNGIDYLIEKWTRFGIWPRRKWGWRRVREFDCEGCRYTRRFDSQDTAEGYVNTLEKLEAAHHRGFHPVTRSKP